MQQPAEAPRISLHQLLRAMVEKGASDLHVTTGSPPQLRIDGQLVPLKTAALTPAETRQICYSVLTEDQQKGFEASQELDLSFGVKNLSRFRANIFMQRGAVAGAFRAIPFHVLSLDDLGVPPIIHQLVDQLQGMVLVTGPTGSGKSTTLAAMIDKVNSETRQHIITIEDPIEYLHPHKKSIVNQREVSIDTRDINNALKYALRQDPDIVLIGEMRDRETMQAALTIAETGHVVLATLHTNSAVHSINRIIDVFPGTQQSQIRTQLSHVLQAVISQKLIARQDGPGRTLATEVLVANPGVRNLIREDKIHQMYTLMQTGQENTGMHTMNQSLVRAVMQGHISEAQARDNSPDLVEFNNLLAPPG